MLAWEGWFHTICCDQEKNLFIPMNNLQKYEKANKWNSAKSAGSSLMSNSTCGYAWVSRDN